MASGGELALHRASDNSVTAPTPKTKSSAVIDRVNVILDTLTHYLPADDLRVRELLQDAKASIPASPAGGHSALACVYQLMGDVENARYHIENAIKLAPSEPIYLMNKTSILINFGYYAEAQKVYAQAADPGRGQMTNAWNQGYTCGAFKTMRNQLDKAVPMKLDIMGLDTETATRAAKVLDQVGLSDPDIGRVLDVAGEVLRDHRLMISNHIPSIAVFDEPGQQPFIQMVYDIPVSPEDAAELYWEFVSRITERMDNLPDVLSVSFRAHRSKDERHATTIA